MAAQKHRLTTNEKWEIGVAVGLIILLLLLAYGNGAQNQGPTNNVGSPVNPGINPLSIWQPDTSPSSVGPVSITVPGLTSPDTTVNGGTPASYNAGNGVACSCGCNNQASFGSLEQMEQTYINEYNSSVSQLFQQSLGALPTWVSQYVNNLTGWYESLVSDQALQ